MQVEELFLSVKEETSAEVYLQEPLKNHTSIKIGGPADILAIPKSIEDLRKIHLLANSLNLPLFILGAGSNLLIADEGFRGMVVKTSGLCAFEIRGEAVLAQAGVYLPSLLKELEKANLSGLEFSAGVPASLGGAVVMNLGAFGAEIGRLISGVKVMNKKGELKTLFQPDLKFGYRRSSLTESELIVLEVILKLSKEDPGRVEGKIKKYLAERKASQPLDKLSCGSIFKNPEGNFAGKLIEETGLKGFKIGDAQVSEKHANFIINLGNASSRDVLALIEKIQETVEQKFRIKLEPEIKIV